MVFERIGRALGLGEDKEFSEKVEEAKRREKALKEGAAASEVENSAPVSTDPAPPAPTEPVEVNELPQVQEIESTTSPKETYVVKSGDTLSAIAQQFYGDANAYMRIFEANRDKLDNPDMIHPGQELTIPR